MKIEGIERLCVCQSFSMFCICTGLDSKKFTVSFQKSKSVGTGVAFRKKLEM